MERFRTLLPARQQKACLTSCHCTIAPKHCCSCRRSDSCCFALKASILKAKTRVHRYSRCSVQRTLYYTSQYVLGYHRLSILYQPNMYMHAYLSTQTRCLHTACVQRSCNALPYAVGASPGGVAGSAARGAFRCAPREARLLRAQGAEEAPQAQPLALQQRALKPPRSTRPLAHVMKKIASKIAD